MRRCSRASQGEGDAVPPGPALAPPSASSTLTEEEEALSAAACISISAAGPQLDEGPAQGEGSAESVANVAASNMHRSSTPSSLWRWSSSPASSSLSSTTSRGVPETPLPPSSLAAGGRALGPSSLRGRRRRIKARVRMASAASRWYAADASLVSVSEGSAGAPPRSEWAHAGGTATAATRASATSVIEDSNRRSRPSGAAEQGGCSQTRLPKSRTAMSLELGEIAVESKSEISCEGWVVYFVLDILIWITQHLIQPTHLDSHEEQG